MFKRNYVLRSPEDNGDGGGVVVDPPVAQVVTAVPAVKPAAPPAAKPEDPKGYWPEDWRQTVSKTDEKVLTRLQRYASPEAALQALIAAQNRISAGELKPVLGKNASAEEIAEWRTAHGIPEAPDKYELKDVKTDSIPKALLDTYLKEAHATNQNPDQVKAGLKAWNTIATNLAQTRAEDDIKAQKDGEDVLRTEWGNEFRRNINLVHGMLDGTTTPELKAALLGGRLADGTPIGSNPDALKFFVSLALIQNPTGVVVPGSEGNQAKGIEDEIGKIEKTMKENRTAYFKDEKMQARYRDLLEAREKVKPR